MLLMVFRRRACYDYSRSLGGDQELRNYLEACGKGRGRCIPDSGPLNADAGLTIITIMPMQTLNIFFSAFYGHPPAGRATFSVNYEGLYYLHRSLA